MNKKGYESGNRNVFKDIGVPSADEHLVKAQLVYKIDAIMKQRRLKQAEAANLLGIKQPDVSKLMNGRHSGFSAERLFRFLNALDEDIQIIVRRKPSRARRRAKISVVAA